MVSKAFVVFLLIIPTIYALEVLYGLNEYVDIKCASNEMVYVQRVEMCVDQSPPTTCSDTACLAFKKCRSQFRICQFNATSSYFGTELDKKLLFKYVCMPYFIRV